MSNNKCIECLLMTCINFLYSDLSKATAPAPVPEPTTTPSSEAGTVSIPPIDLGNSRPVPLSVSELWAGKASQSELADNPIFNKTTSQGVPSSRLYVKNLNSKTTTEDDLWRVFGSFREQTAVGEASQFSVQLLTGGRMKGTYYGIFSVSCKDKWSSYNTYVHQRTFQIIESET